MSTSISPRESLSLALITAALVILLMASATQALIVVGKGNDPISDHNWPAGSLDLANLKNRAGWYEGPPFGGGQFCFLYRGDAAALQAALELFARIDTPELSLVVHEGPGATPFLRDEKDAHGGAFDYSFTVWDPRSFNRLYNDPTTTFSADDPNGNFRRGSVEPPRMDVFVGDGKAGVDWTTVKVPAKVKVTDERASAAGYAAEAGSVLRGVAYDMTTSKPLANATIALVRDAGQRDEIPVTLAGATTGADGRFELTKVAPGAYHVRAKADGYASRILTFVEFKRDTLKEFVVRLAPPAELKGVVLDASGKPVKGITVRADNVMGPDGRGYQVATPTRATTDERGAFVIPGLPRGHCKPFAYAPGYSMVDPLKALVTIPTEGGLTLRVAQAGNVRATVIAPGGGAPRQQYMVGIEPEDGSKLGSYGGSGNVDPTGVMTFENVPPGKYRITARPNPGTVVRGKDPNEQLIEVRGGWTNDVKFEVK